MSEPELTHAEWIARAEVLRRDPADPLSFPLRCVACGHVATPRDFVNLGADAQQATTECIGRVQGGVAWLNELQNGRQPCDWATYGLLADLGKGQPVRTESGRVVLAMPFAV